MREREKREQCERVCRRLERSVVEMEKKWQDRERKERGEREEREGVERERVEKRKKRDEIRELCEMMRENGSKKAKRD